MKDSAPWTCTDIGIGRVYTEFTSERDCLLRPCVCWQVRVWSHSSWQRCSCPIASIALQTGGTSARSHVLKSAWSLQPQSNLYKFGDMSRQVQVSQSLWLIPTEVQILAAIVEVTVTWVVPLSGYIVEEMLWYYKLLWQYRIRKFEKWPFIWPSFYWFTQNSGHSPPFSCALTSFRRLVNFLPWSRMQKISRNMYQPVYNA